MSDYLITSYKSDLAAENCSTVWIILPLWRNNVIELFYLRQLIIIRKVKRYHFLESTITEVIIIVPGIKPYELQQYFQFDLQTQMRIMKVR